MNKQSALIAAVMITAVLCGCAAAPVQAPAQEAPGVEIRVVTSYGGNDGNRKNYEAACAAYEEATGNAVIDDSSSSDEAWKNKVMTDFETGAEPDVLFYFNGADSNQLVQAKKVVSLEEIRAVYPDYASNMKDELLGASPLDGRNYSVPVNGYWEGLYVNVKVLSACGIPVPGADYTWQQFLVDCETIKRAGYTPIAASLQEIPHYWFEFAVFNHGNMSNHLDVPTSMDDAVARKWSAGIADIKALYDAGYFPENTLTATNAQICQLLADGKAAFMVEGSWRVGWLRENAPAGDITVTYVPGTGERPATDMIGGLSMGYYITRKAWEDGAKRQACVDFVTMMTSDSVVSAFGASAMTALKSGAAAYTEADALDSAAGRMVQNATGVSAATQDGLSAEARAALFANIKNIVTDKISAEEAIAAALALN